MLIWKQNSKIALQIGTLSACLFSLALFLSLSLLTAITCDPTLLFHDCNYMSTISIWSPIVAIGVLLATFSASLNNIIGGSRVLEAVAKDVLFGPFLTYINKVRNMFWLPVGLLQMLKHITFRGEALSYWQCFETQNTLVILVCL